MDATIHMRASDMPKLHGVSRRMSIRQEVFLGGGGYQGERAAKDAGAIRAPQLRLSRVVARPFGRVFFSPVRSARPEAEI
jgi:hypothetical protein